MILMDIVRECGHAEAIGLAGFSGHIDNIPIQYKEQCEKNIQWQRDKLCLKCFNKLPDEEKRRLLKEVIDGAGE